MQFVITQTAFTLTSRNRLVIKLDSLVYIFDIHLSKKYFLFDLIILLSVM